ncbi:DNA polymerase IV [Actinobaculum sp. 352]|uniref:DNA polymerase IV n=1 Tax=Actinobaculum sp. 352 TaxID=2490946 RepID=UPI000F7E0A49|nr:DNA polymerase IV [Actinobaculum sp. 352]RTE48104.1 DNA polymerase IV [Actinobaculum sp. 352]
MSRAPRSDQARRSWGDDDSATPILHVDMDAFFVSVELLDHPELRGKPVAVGGKERGVIAAASYEAREFGVNSAMPVGLAYRRCPQLVMLQPRGSVYRAVSRRIMEILREVTPRMEQVSVDEAFLDVSGARRLFGSPVQIATSLRRSIREQENVPASIGIAATKHVAKIASAHAKPDGLLLIPADATLPFLHSLPVGTISGVGDRTREKLALQGVETVGDLAALGEARLVRLLGKAAGQHLYELSMGIDPRPVVPSREEKSLGREETFFEYLEGRRAMERVLLRQAHDTARRLRERGLVAATVAIKVRFADFTTITRSVTLDRPTSLAADLYDHAQRLFSEVRIPSGGLRLLGLRAEGLQSARGGIQLAFDDDPRRGKAENAMDGIRKKFGESALGPASLLADDQVEDRGSRHPRE